MNHAMLALLGYWLGFWMAGIPPGSILVIDPGGLSPFGPITYSRGSNAFTSYVLEDITGLEGSHYPQQVFATKNGAIIFVHVKNPDGKTRQIAVIGTYKKTRRSNPN